MSLSFHLILYFEAFDLYIYIYTKKKFVGRKTLTELVPGPAFEPVNVYNMLQVIEENKSFKVCPTLSYCT